MSEERTYAEAAFGFHSLFEVTLAEENMYSNNSMAILGDTLLEKIPHSHTVHKKYLVMFGILAG